LLLVGGAFGLWLLLPDKRDNKATPVAENPIQRVQAAIPQQIPPIPGKSIISTNILPKSSVQTGVSPTKFTPSKADLQESARLEKGYILASARRRFRNIESTFAPLGKPSSLPAYLANSTILDWKIQSILNDVTGKKEYLEVVVLKTRDGSDYRLERAAIGQSQSGNLPWTEMMGNELLVTLNTQNVPPGFIEDKGIRIEFLKTEGLKDTYQIRFRSENAESLPKAYDLFESKMKEFKNLQPQFIYHACATPTDPGYASSSANRWHLEKVGMPAVWDKIQNTDVTVAVLDTGVNYNHEDLKDNIYTFPDGTHGWDFANNNAYPLDAGYTKNGLLIYHGSHCAGIIGMRGNNNAGSVGACHRIKILPLRLGSESTSSRVKQALIFCSTSSANVQIASMSFSTSSGPDPDMQTLEAFTDYFNNGRRIGVIAAGNEANNIDTGVKKWPASFNYSFLIKVANSDGNDAKAVTSNYGVTSVDLAAPGELIYSVNGANDFGYTTISGTSMSTPLVAGALALLRAAAPQKTASELIACLN
jgi:subtilisin family serine protease